MGLRQNWLFGADRRMSRARREPRPVQREEPHYVCLSQAHPRYVRSVRVPLSRPRAIGQSDPSGLLVLFGIVDAGRARGDGMSLDSVWSLVLSYGLPSASPS